MYATHEYGGELSFERPATSTQAFNETNVRVTGPAGAVRRFRAKQPGRGASAAGALSLSLTSI
jgi:hypothetical protein